MEIKESKRIKLRFTMSDLIDKLIPPGLEAQYEHISVNMHCGNRSIAYNTRQNNTEKFGLTIVLMDEE